jgi:hypothetical protein
MECGQRYVFSEIKWENPANIFPVTGEGRRHGTGSYPLPPHGLQRRKRLKER